SMESVLVVDDDRHIADLIKLHLEREGYKVEVAHDGKSALEKAARDRPDLVVLDVMLPGKNGLEVCQEMRRWDGPQPIILILTATEFNLLHHLASSPGLVLSREHLLRTVWGYHHDGYQRTVDSHITRVRRKLESAGASPSLIATVHGVGYRFEPADQAT